MKKAARTIVGYIVIGASMMAGARAIDVLWPAPVKVLVCFDLGGEHCEALQSEAQGDALDKTLRDSL